ncbi:MAG: ABC transporter permease, partial [Saezia sp.]
MQRDDMGRPLIELKKLRKEFISGGEPVAVLKDVDLSINAGEIVAIVGASGSGKSTLMNIIGCLDQASSGDYLLDGKEVKGLDADELAALRRERFGFIFQRYHLLSDLTAQGNVEVPAIYAGYPSELRHQRSKQILTRLGLSDRMEHKPSQLSGGQQQRVSIARALMNGGSVILADEPTGALDSQSGVEVMKILTELHEAGHTIIIVTHDMSIAAYANRVIEIKDGEIIGDTRKVKEQAAVDSKELLVKGQKHPLLAVWGRLSEAFKMAVLAMRSHKLRTFLTMLGIIIGIASVVSVVALGEGSKQSVLKSISSIGTNTITIFPSRGFGDTRSGRIETLVPADAKILGAQGYVDSVTPVASISRVARYGNVEATSSVQGVSYQYFRVQDVEIAEGIAFDEAAENELAQVAVIDHNTREKFFTEYEDPIGQVIFLGSMPVRIIGVAAKKENAFAAGDTLSVYLPYTTVLKRMQGQNHLN